MQEIVGTKPTADLQYLQIWIGLIGASVGLSLPKELAVKTSEIVEGEKEYLSQ